MSEKNPHVLSKKIYDLGSGIMCALGVYDLIPPHSREIENFVRFLRLLEFCTRNKMYSARDLAIRKLIEKFESLSD